MRFRAAHIAKLLFQRAEGRFLWGMLATGVFALWAPLGLSPTAAEIALLLMQVLGTLAAIYLLNDQRSSMGARSLWELLKAWAGEFFPKVHNATAQLRGLESRLDAGFAVGTVGVSPATPVDEQLRRIWQALEHVEGKVEQTAHEIEVHRRTTTEALAKLRSDFNEQVELLERELQERLTAKPFLLYLSWRLILASTLGQLVLKSQGPLS